MEARLRHRLRQPDPIFPPEYDLPPIPSREEERALGRRAQAGDLEARNHLVLAHLPAILRFAQQMGGRRVHGKDLVGVGVLMLMRAIARWEIDRGTRLTTFFWRLTKQRMLNATADPIAGIAVPPNLIEEWYRYRRELQTGKPPRKPYGNRALVEHVDDLMGRKTIRFGTRSRFKSGGQEGGEIDAAYLEQLGIPGDQFLVEDADWTESLFRGLDARSALILRLRFGFPPEHVELTHREISLKLGVTRERVRQIEEQALCRIRRRLQPGSPRDETCRDRRRLTARSCGAD